MSKDNSTSIWRHLHELIFSFPTFSPLPSDPHRNHFLFPPSPSAPPPIIPPPPSPPFHPDPQVWARAGGGVHQPPEEIVWNEAENWGIGSNIVTTLYSEKQEVGQSEWLLAMLLYSRGHTNENIPQELKSTDAASILCHNLMRFECFVGVDGVCSYAKYKS